MKKQGAGDSAGARSLSGREPHHVVLPGEEGVRCGNSTGDGGGEDRRVPARGLPEKGAWETSLGVFKGKSRIPI